MCGFLVYAIALQVTFQLLEISKRSSLLTEHCCYQQDTYKPNLKLGMDFQGRCPLQWQFTLCLKNFLGAFGVYPTAELHLL